MPIPQINMIFIGSFVLLLALTTINAQNNCSGRNANCITILECPEVLSILRGPRPFSTQTLLMLRSLQCGTEGSFPKVCCNQLGQQAGIVTMNREAEQEEIPDPPDVIHHPNQRLLDHQGCGPLNNAKIVNGNKTGIFQYPWMALIAYERDGVKDFYCGGTIINSRYVLTAAHCIKALPSDIKLIGVRVGDHDISKERDCETDVKGRVVVCAERYQEYSLESSHPHPQYSKSKQQNDIGLIRLNTTINFRPHIKTICLPFGSTANQKLKKQAVVTGWGMTEMDRRSSELLQAKMPVISLDQCKEIYNPDKEISYKQICAGGQMNVDSCNGDSGGPLQTTGIYNSTSARMVQYGIVSFGLSPCGIQGIPGVYTNIAYYMDWILDTMRD